MRNQLTAIALLLAMLVSAGCATATPPSKAGSAPGQAVATTEPEPSPAVERAITGHIKGNISDIQPADAAAIEGGRLGLVRIEGEKVPGNEYDKAVVTVTKDTLIYKQDGDSLVPVTFEALAFGQTVTAEFVGPIRESYPVQVTAGQIVILAEMPRN